MKKDDMLIAYFRSLVYFEDLAPDILRGLVSHAQRHIFTPNEIIFLENESASGLWLVEQGRVKIYKLNPEGREHVLRIFGDKDTFNDIPAFDNGLNPANATALSDCILWVLPCQVIQELILRDAKFALRVIQILSRRVRGLIRQIEELALYSVIVRVARLVLNQVDDPALSGQGVTRATIASHLATTPQTISTALRELEGAGAIVFDRHKIIIVREDILRSIAML
ncbi:MAG: Crp/Fnr family transcriptional regulator [Anaerolineae bacterium]|jgi:CRP/FNR family transcriptional regulator|nr:Crp/Fnr family transcriptional regulator [Anaerolineae bacterium]